ncbi:MAG TPA: endonuclease III [Candidatus Polarisedimenticolia bacterium]|nr:endonuclease III [Candidatus Polarisedimenticolia bacterium]
MSPPSRALSGKRGDPGTELRRRAGRLLRALKRSNAEAHIELDFRTPFELLVATILSAQCTDARVNKVTPDLFRAYPDVAALADADPERLESLIRSTGFFRSKSRALLGASRALRDEHGGEVPRTMEELSRLPGVGRKTANVVLGGAYGIPTGVVVDTHVQRVARRLRLTRHDDPVRIERDLMALWPRSDWIFASIALVLHGRYICVARTPRCSGCPLSRDCPSRTLGGLPALRRSPDRARD